MNEIDINWYGPETATFGDRVAGAREASGLSQAQLAKGLAVKQSTLRSWEQDLSEPRANKLSMLAGILNVSVMWLLNGEGEGIGHPDEAERVSKDLDDMLLEMRELRALLKSSCDRLGSLEKRLRQKLKVS